MLKLTVSKAWARSYASWEAGPSITIQVSSLVVNGIRTEFMKEFDAISHGEHMAEIGGLLLGRTEENVIIVDDFEPVWCEHRFGPTLRLSDSDRMAWRETLQRMHQRKEFATVGWYRTDGHGEFTFRENDRELSRFESRDDEVILFIKPSRSQPYDDLKLFLRCKGQLRGARQVSYFPFDPRLTGRPRAPIVDRPPTFEPAVQEEARLNRTEEESSNIGGDAEHFDHGNHSPSHGLTMAAAVGQSGLEFSTDSRTDKDYGPDDSVPTVIETEPQPQTDHSERTSQLHRFRIRPNPNVSEAVQHSNPAEAEQVQPESAVLGSVDDNRSSKKQHPEKQKTRKSNFIVAAVLFTTITGTLGYYSLTRRSAARVVLAPSEPSTTPSADPKPIAATPERPQISAAVRDDNVSDRQSANRTEREPVTVTRDTNQEIRLFLQKWATAETSTNVRDVEDFYAPRLSRYFTNRKVTVAGVHAARTKDQSKYGRLIVCELKDLTVKPIDEDHIIATFRKHWQTAGPTVLIGDQQERVTLIRNEQNWQIGAEQRTKLYRLQKEHRSVASLK